MISDETSVVIRFFLCYTTRKWDLAKGGRTLSDIDCRIAESMVTKYINHTLSINELEEFLDHIEHCSSCYDELETYFIVHEAIQQLDEKDDGSVLDFRELLEQDIRRTRRHIRQKRWLHFLSVLLFSAVLIAVAVFAIFLAMEIKHFL
ncbi:zf-HC2 domain-containing protein [Blautia sp. MSJ-19]|nr:zf-HC2 domain-containing protein [Blautia sp. MSJ-19]